MGLKWILGVQGIAPCLKLVSVDCPDQVFAVVQESGGVHCIETRESHYEVDGLDEAMAFALNFYKYPLESEDPYFSEK